MEDLLKDLAQAKPATPEVDHDRMERDLARIISLPRPREWTGAPSFTRRFGPVLVGFAAVVLLVLTTLPSDRPAQVAEPSKWWHVQTRHSSLLPVGDPANPYVMQLTSDTDEWFAPGRHVQVSQLSGVVSPRSADDGTKWEAAGSPTKVPIVGMNHSLRIGPMKPGAWTDENPVFGGVPFAEIDKQPADVDGLRKVVDSPGVAIGLATAPLRPDQRHALLALLKTLPKATVVDALAQNGANVSVILAPTDSPQFGHVENQLIVDERTALPISYRQVMTTPRYGLPAGTVVRSEEYLHLGMTDGTLGPPADATTIGEVESPIIER